MPVQTPAHKCLACGDYLYLRPSMGYHCVNPTCILVGIEYDANEPGEVANIQNYRQQKIIEMASEAADRIIMNNSSGSVEETDYLTSAVAMKFVSKAHLAISSRLTRREMMERAGMEETSAKDLLVIALSAAVPLWIEKLKTRSWAELEERRQACVEIISSHGDNILFRSKKKGDTAQAFNALAEATAILSFVPGGIKAFGLEFKAVHPEGGHNRETPAADTGL